MKLLIICIVHLNGISTFVLCIPKMKYMKQFVDIILDLTDRQMHTCMYNIIIQTIMYKLLQRSCMMSDKHVILFVVYVPLRLLT